MSKGLKCPLCGSWYSTNNEAKELGVYFEEGELCNNQAMTGPNPKLCSPEHPCKGRLVRVGDDNDGQITAADLKRAFEADDDDDDDK